MVIACAAMPPKLVGAAFDRSWRRSAGRSPFRAQYNAGRAVFPHIELTRHTRLTNEEERNGLADPPVPRAAGTPYQDRRPHGVGNALPTATPAAPRLRA